MEVPALYTNVGDADVKKRDVASRSCYLLRMT